MTINTETRVAGPFEGNDATTVFPFTFKVFDSDEVLVVHEVDAVESVLALGADYSVTLNPDQNASPGGSVTLLAGPLAVNTTLTLTSALDYLQPLDLTNQGGFYPRVINNAFDRVTILVQQLLERLGRALVFPISDGPVGEMPGRGARAGAVLAFDTITGDPIVGPTIADVGTVAAANEAIAIVASNIDDVNTVADNLGDITNFADVYYGPAAVDPTTRDDGSPMQVGDLYFNTESDRLRIFDGSTWRETVGGSMSVQNFSGDGVETEFLLNYAPGDEIVTQVYISGVYQQKNTYEIGGAGGDVLIFTAAPPAGTDNIEVVVSSAVPSDDLLRLDLADVDQGAALVAFKQVGAGAVDRTMEDKARDFVSVTDFGAVGNGVADDTAALAAAGDTAFMPEGEYVTTSLTAEYNSHKSGPGYLSSVGTLFNNGANARSSAHGNHLADTLRQNYAMEGTPASRSTVLAVTSVSVPSATFTVLSMTRVQEGAAVFFPGVSASSIFATSRTKVMSISGSISFAASTGGAVRTVVLRKNGAVHRQINVFPCGGGAATSVTFNFTPTTIPGDYFELSAYHDAGAALSITSGDVLVSIAAEAPHKMGGKRLLIYQGSWATQEALYGSYEALLAAVAQYDVLALSHIETFGALPYPMLPNPNGIMDVGYKHLKRLIHDYKFLRPDGLVFGYVSAAIDAPTWDGGGNPTTNTWTSTTYPNFQWWCNLWLKDRHLPIDGFFLDHFNSAFMSAIARDNVASLVKRVYGKKMMVNITAASSAAVRWASECKVLGYGDYLCLEGFYRDNGADSLAGTNAAITELAFNDARGLLFAVVNEEAAGTPINNGSTNNVNGASLFNSFYKLGWCYQYGRVTYDTIGTPGI